MSRFRRLRQSLTSENVSKVDVTCPNCGRVTSFSITEEVPDRSKLVCNNCKTDISNPFLSEFINVEIDKLKATRKVLLRSFLISLLPVAFLIYFLFIRNNQQFLIYLLFVVSLILSILSVVILVRIQIQMKKLKDLQKEHDLA